MSKYMKTMRPTLRMTPNELDLLLSSSTEDEPPTVRRPEVTEALAARCRELPTIRRSL